MHPEIAKALVAQHRDELVRDSASRHRARRRRFPRWHVSWTRTVLAPAVAAVLVLVLDAVLPRGLLARRGALILDLVAGLGLLAGVVALVRLAGRAGATFCATGRTGGCSYVVEPVTSPGEQCDGRPLGGQCQCRRFADATAGAGYQRDCSVE